MFSRTPFALSTAFLLCGAVSAQAQGDFAQTSPTKLSSEGPGRLAAPFVVIDDLSRFESLLHVDGDGHIDAFGWWWQDTDYREIEIMGYTNDGRGGFVEDWSIDLDTFVMSNSPTFNASGVGDLDGDGFDDFALSFHDTIYLYKTNGTSPPTLLEEIELVSSSLNSLVIADFNDDGLDDLAAYDGNITST